MSKFNIIVRSEEGYRWVLANYKDNLPRFCSDLYGTEEENIFSRAVAKFHHLIIMEEENSESASIF